jgi:N6-adenosine-specific RNA methylase IME4
MAVRRALFRQLDGNIRGNPKNLPLIEETCPGSKLEIFSRQERPDWQVFGDQSPLFSQQGEHSCGILRI